MDRIDTFIDAVKSYKEPEHSPEIKKIIKARKYSSYNLRLIDNQRTGSTLAKTAFYWRENWGRKLKASARPIAVFRKGGPPLFIYDFVDTCPDPYLHGVEITNPDVLCLLKPFQVNGPEEVDYVSCKRNISSYGIDIDDSLDFAYGYGGGFECSRNTNKEPHRIYLNSNYSDDRNAMASLLAHETAHLLLGHGRYNEWDIIDDEEPDSTQQELEAELIAYLVMDDLGISTMKKSVSYVAKRYKQLNDYLKIMNLRSYGVAVNKDLIEETAELVTSMFLRRADDNDEKIKKMIFVKPEDYFGDSIAF